MKEKTFAERLEKRRDEFHGFRKPLTLAEIYEKEGDFDSYEIAGYVIGNKTTAWQTECYARY